MTDVNENPTPFVDTTERKTAETVFEAITKLVHSDQIEVVNFHAPFNSEEAIQAQVVIGAPSEEDGHIVVSTYGLGGVETPAKAQIDENEMPLRMEIFAIAANPEEARIVAEELAALEFHMNSTKTPLLPGVIAGRAGAVHYAISASPYGTLGGHGHQPIRNQKYLVSFFAANRITENEAKMLSEEETAPKFLEYYKSLGIDAYSLNRPEFNEE